MTATTATVVDLPRQHRRGRQGHSPSRRSVRSPSKEQAASPGGRGTQDARHRAAASSTRRASTRTFQTEVTSLDPTEARAMTDLDQFRAELAGSLAGLSPSQRLKAGREMADRLGVVLAAIERAARSTRAPPRPHGCRARRWRWRP